LSQTFKNNIHNNNEIQDQYPTSSSDVFLSKNDNSGGKTREASDGVEYDFYLTEYDYFIYLFIYHFCILFGHVDWLKTGRMTFYNTYYYTSYINYHK
jgi:hypothetical protein